MTDQTETQPEAQPEPQEESLIKYQSPVEESSETTEEVKHKDADPGSLADTSEPEIPKKPEYVQEQFYNAETGDVDVEKLSKSYNDLRSQFNKGNHKAPDNGEYDIRSLVEKGIRADDPMLSKTLEWAKDSKLSQYDFSKLANMIVDLQIEGAVEEERTIAEEKAALGPKADQRIEAMSNWIQGLERKNVLNNAQAKEAAEIMAGSARGIEVFEKLQKYYGESSAPIDVHTADQDSQEELDAMVANPEFKTNPAFRKQVEKKFEKKYGTEAKNPMAHSIPLFRDG